ncbi:UDP-N-acetylmuramoyl-L-alanyl-D-glutamate--2,6-diaminopimelate ligase [Candidatus Nomurabacteria bacterium]|nr:UDP-N-acetylmuramoyl-L-alanyl-D-glutamate--2,6-diaminopimelate ligase [Candidatus Nomurabacteria bacterium]
MKKIIKKIWWAVKLFAAQVRHGYPSRKLKIVGVTGTNGKTTTATLLYKINTALGYKSGLVSTVENIIGKRVVPSTMTTPDSVTLTKLFAEMAREGCEYVFMEVSSHALDQKRVAGINFVGGIFTNLTHDHLDYHKNFDNYFGAKKKFFKMLPSSAFALSNADDEYGLKILEGIQAKKYTYGFKNKADFNEKLDTKLLGNFNAYNALAVYASAVLLEHDKEKVKKILSNLEPPKGRFQHFTSKNDVLVIVDYAHTPDALEKIFLAVKEINSAEVGLPQKLPQKGKIISVFGCGGDRDPLKRSIMGKIGAINSNIAIFTSDNPRSEDPEKIIEQMKTTLSPLELKKVKTISNRREAIQEAAKLARKGDIILCAGKGHEDYQEIQGVKNHFDDMEELKRAFK